MSGTTTKTATYTVADVANVVRRLTADLAMIADSTGAWSSGTVADHVHDIELLAGKGYLDWVDVTLFSGQQEVMAVRYDVKTDAGHLPSDRPGGVLWPRVPSPSLRLLIHHAASYDEEARQALRGRLRLNWTTSNDDASHSSLTAGGGRNYTSNAFGMTRKDWTK